MLHPSIHLSIYSLISKGTGSNHQLPGTHKHCAGDVSRERKERRKPRKMYLTHVYLNELTLQVQYLFLQPSMTIQKGPIVKLCDLKIKFQKMLPFWLNKKQDFSREVLCLC